MDWKTQDCELFVLVRIIYAGEVHTHELFSQRIPAGSSAEIKAMAVKSWLAAKESWKEYIEIMALALGLDVDEILRGSGALTAYRGYDPVTGEWIPGSGTAPESK